MTSPRRTADRRSPLPVGPSPPPWLLVTTAGLVALIVLSWTSTGSLFLSRRVPSMDSVAYQEEAFGVIAEAWRGGYLAGWQESFEPRHAAANALHRIVLAAISPLMPLSRAALYVYLFGAHAMALMCLAVFLYRRTRSPWLALLGPVAYVTGAPFGTLSVTPVVDQNLDLASAAFLLLTFLAAWRWMERPTLSRALLTGAALGAATLHRSICGPQLALLLSVFFGLGLFDARASKKPLAAQKLAAQGLAALALAAAMAAPWYWPHREAIFRYYGVYSYAVGKPMSLGATIAANLEHVRVTWWNGAWVVLAVLALVAALTRTVRWRGLAMIAIAFVSPLVPLVLSRSEVVEPVYPTLAAFALAPLMVADARRLSLGGPWTASAPPILLAATLLAAGVQAEHLAREVSRLSPQVRVDAMRLIDRLITEVPQRPLRIAGFVTQAHSPVGLASLIRIERQEWGRPGPQAILEGDFFIPVEQGCDGERCWEEVPDQTRRAGIECAIERMIDTSQVILVADPERIAQFEYDFVFFGHAHQAEIARALAADSRLAGRGFPYDLAGVPGRAYVVPDDAEADLSVCCSPALTPNAHCRP